MRSFLALVSKRGTLSRELLSTVPRWAADALPFRHMQYQTGRWLAPSGRVGLFVWDNDIQGTGSRVLIHYSEGFAVTASGYVSHPMIADGFDLESIATAVSIDPPTVPLLGGAFALLRAEEWTDTVSIWNTVTRLVPVYWGETDEAVILGTRALLVSFVLAGQARPDYQPTNLISFLADGFFASEATPYRGVNVMPANTRLIASETGVRMIPIDDFDRECGTVAPTKAEYESITALLLQAIGSFRGNQVECSLTGGKDSRLVVAALRAAGVDFITGTNGFAGHPDVVIAKQVAKLLGVRHRHNVPATNVSGGKSVITVDLLERARRSLFGTDGMLFAYENVGYAARFGRASIGMGGGAGESLRGGFAKTVAHKGDVTRESANRFIKGRYLGPPDLFDPSASAVYGAFLDEWLAREIESSRPAVALDRFYLTFRSGRWLSATRSARFGGYGLHPLADNLVTKAGLRMHESAKLSDELVYEMLKRLAPELIDVPFAGARWNFEKQRPREGDEESWRRRAPLMVEDGSRGAFNWRSTVTTDLFDAFYDQIFNDSRASALFDVVNKNRLREMMEVERGQPPKSRRMVLYWSIYSASVLLSNQWLERDGGKRIVEIAIPPDPLVPPA